MRYVAQLYSNFMYKIGDECERVSIFIFFYMPLIIAFAMMTYRLVSYKVLCIDPFTAIVSGFLGGWMLGYLVAAFVAIVLLALSIFEVLLN